MSALDPGGTLATVRHDWEKKADRMEQSLPRLGRFPVSGLVRRARRINDMSQRQMATMARVSASTVGKVESGAMVASVDVLQRLLGTAGLCLVVWTSRAGWSSR